MGEVVLRKQVSLLWIFAAAVLYCQVAAVPLDEVPTDGGEETQLLVASTVSECSKTSAEVLDCPTLCENGRSQCYLNGGNETELCICDNRKQEIPYMENSYLCSEDLEDASYTYGLEDREPKNVERCRQECYALIGDYEPKYCIRRDEPSAGKLVCVCYEAGSEYASEHLEIEDGVTEEPGTEDQTMLQKNTGKKEKKEKKENGKGKAGKGGSLPPGVSINNPAESSPANCNVGLKPGKVGKCVGNAAEGVAIGVGDTAAG